MLISNHINFSLKPSNKKIVMYSLYIFTTALFIRLLNLIFINELESYSLLEDAYIYWEGAHSWISTGYFSRTTNGIDYHETERVPAYFLFLALIIKFINSHILTVIFIQAIIDSLTCILIFLIGSFINKKVGIMAGIFSIFNFNFIIHSSMILTETLFLFFICLILFFMLTFFSKVNLLSVILIGLTCGFAIMTRSLVLFFPIGIAFIITIIVFFQKKSLIKGISLGLVVIIISSLVISPILLRNLKKYDSFSLTSQNGVFLLDWCVGTIKSLEEGKEFSKISNELEKKVQNEIEKKFNNDDLNPFQLSQIRIEVALEELKKMPMSSLILGWSHGAVQNLVSPSILLDPRVRSFNKLSFYETKGNNIFEKTMIFILKNDKQYILFLILGMISSIIFVTLQFTGIILLIKDNIILAILMLLYILYFIIICGPVGGPKYRIPLDPILIILQSYAVIWAHNLFQKIYNRNK